MTERWPADPASIAAAGARLRAGGVIAFPTDTLYAVGARASDPAAVERLYEVKRRPRSQPLVLLVRGLGDIRERATLSAHAIDLVARFWPGPLTLVLPGRSGLAGETIAARAPNHPVAMAVLNGLGEPIASSSANPAGEPPPADADAVLAGLGRGLDLVLDGGACQLGQPSTILDLTGPTPRILRSGAVSDRDLGIR
jgi:L-threonylcarbamoyladenylate synthase